MLGLTLNETDKLIKFIRNKKLKIIVGGSTTQQIDFDHDFVMFEQLESKLNKNFDFSKSIIQYKLNDFIFFNEVLSIKISRGCAFKCKVTHW